jgi:hypothetical protein
MSIEGRRYSMEGGGWREEGNTYRGDEYIKGGGKEY